MGQAPRWIGEHSATLSATVCVPEGQGIIQSQPGSKPGNGVHDPAEHESDSNKSAEDLGTVYNAVAGSILAQHSEDHGDQEGE